MTSIKETYARDEWATAYLEYDGKQLDGDAIKHLISNILVNNIKDIPVKFGLALKNPKDSFDRKLGNRVAKKDAESALLRPIPRSLSIIPSEGVICASLSFSVIQNQMVGSLIISWQFHVNNDSPIDFRSSPRIRVFTPNDDSDFRHSGLTGNSVYFN